MKKIFYLLFLLFGIVLFNSCDKSCTCVAPDNAVTEIDVFITDECNTYSSTEVGDCY